MQTKVSDDRVVEVASMIASQLTLVESDLEKLVNDLSEYFDCDLSDRVELVKRGMEAAELSFEEEEDDVDVGPSPVVSPARGGGAIEAEQRNIAMDYAVRNSRRKKLF
jgi:hypothetical protein